MANEIEIMDGQGLDLDAINSTERFSILIIDDEPDTVVLLKSMLMSAGFNVVSSGSGAEAVRKFPIFKPDLVVMDIMMPEMDGWETLQYIRQLSDVPIIVLSAMGTKEDVVNGLRHGVDDYVSKPFHRDELVERIRAVLRRSHRPKEVSRLVYPHINLVIDLMSQEVCYRNQNIRLTTKEFAVLLVLAKFAPAVVNYQTISETVWDEDNEDTRKRIKYLVYLLRQKFTAIDPNRDVIVTVDRVGYKLEAG